jgi:hypothetical protein
MLKWLLGIGLVVLIAFGMAGYYLYSNLDLFVEQAIEQIGSEAVGVAVRVDRVELDLAAGRASVFGLSVANPEGFEAAQAFTLAEITVALDLESLRDQAPIVLDELRIESPVVFYELNSANESNLQILGENASRGSDAGATDEAVGEPEPPLRLRIRKIRFADGRVDADTRAIGGIQMEAKLVTATLTDVGGPNGATGAEIGSILVEELGRQTVLAIGKAQLDKIMKSQLGDEGSKAAKKLLNVFGR